MGGCGSGRKGENGGDGEDGQQENVRKWQAGAVRADTERQGRRAHSFGRLLGRRSGVFLMPNMEHPVRGPSRPITYASPFLDLRWVSLATSLCGTMVAALFRHRVSALLQRPTFLYAIGAVAALGSILGPLSALYPPTSKALIYIAAVCVGVGFAFLFFCGSSAFAAHAT